MTKKEACNCLLTHDGKGKETKSKALHILIALARIEAFEEVSRYYGEDAFYSNNKQSGEESVYWAKKADSLKAILEKTNL